MEIENVISHIYDNIKDKVNNNWNKISKIRFIYLSVGIFLEKNTDFFLNDKLDDLKLNDDDMLRIYQNNYINERTYDGGRQFQIICKSAALILKGIFKKFDIDSSLVVTCGNEDEIRHWFLTAIGDNGEQFFLTLAADLPYIKNKFPTQHFANSINFFNSQVLKNDVEKEISSYDRLLSRISLLGLSVNDFVIVSKDNEFFVISKEDLKFIEIKSDNVKIMELNSCDDFLKKHTGNIVFATRQYEYSDGLSYRKKQRNINGIDVEYSEIDYTDLNMNGSLRSIDTAIGYSDLYESENLISEQDYMKLFYVYFEENSDFFKIIHDSLEVGNGHSKSVDDITEVQVQRMISSIDAYIAQYLNQIYDTDIFHSDDYMQKFLSFNNFPINEEITLKANLKKYKKDISLDFKTSDLVAMLLNIISIEERFLKYIDIKNKMEHQHELIEHTIQDYHSSSVKNKNDEDIIYDLNMKYFELEKEYDSASKDLSIQKLNPILNRIAYYFIVNNYDKMFFHSDSNQFISQDYIYNKFCAMFPMVFDCNYEDNMTLAKTSFSIQGYSEQVVIIKEFLKLLFSELTEKNCSLVSQYDKIYSPVENRIRVYPLRNRQTNEYAIGFRFWANPNDALEEEKTMIYIPSLNTLRDYNPIKDRKQSLSVSSTKIGRAHV